MTSASELFYNRRSRIGRSSIDLGVDSPPPPQTRSFQHSPTANGRRNFHRHDSDGCDPLRRYPHSRNSFTRVSLQERGSFRLELSASQFSSGEDVRSPEPVSPSERLPGAVLLARARLRERLRGLPPPATRQHGRVPSNLNPSEVRHSESQSPFDTNDRGTESLFGRWSFYVSPSTDLSSQNSRLQLLGEQSKKPVGLSQEALDCLISEQFSIDEEMGIGEEKDEERVVLRSSRDCSICLESFALGNELIRLPCEHRFHSACLRPWVQICGDCPYCRRVIYVRKVTTSKPL